MTDKERLDCDKTQRRTNAQAQNRVCCRESHFFTKVYGTIQNKHLCHLQNTKKRQLHFSMYEILSSDQNICVYLVNFTNIIRPTNKPLTLQNEETYSLFIQRRIYRFLLFYLAYLCSKCYLRMSVRWLFHPCVDLSVRSSVRCPPVSPYVRPSIRLFILSSIRPSVRQSFRQFFRLRSYIVQIAEL